MTNSAFPDESGSGTQEPPPPSSLAECVGRDSNCEKLVTQADELAKSLFSGTDEAETRQPDPWLVGTAEERFAYIEERANQIIYGDRQLEEEPGHAVIRFEPSPEEAMYLRAAIRLFEIGLLFGIDSKDEGPSPEYWIKIRDEHHSRARDYILGRWKDNCDWNDKQKEHLATLCLFHRHSSSIDAIGSPGETESGAPIRLQELVGILRLANATDFSSYRAPCDLQDRFDAPELSDTMIIDWKFEPLVREVVIDHRRRCIAIKADIPLTHPFGTAVVDFEPILQRYKEGVQEELTCIHKALLSYRNLAFTDVRLDIQRPPVLGQPQVLDRMLAVWPYMLKITACASEVASVLGALLWAHIRRADAVRKKELLSLLDLAAKMHPFNYLVGRLVREAREKIAKSSSANELQDYLENDFLKRRESGCQQLSFDARRELMVKPDEHGKPRIDQNATLIIYGYSRNVMIFARDQIAAGVNGRILVVKCLRENKFTPGGDYETDRILEEMDARGYKGRCQCVEIADLHSVFQRIADEAQLVFLVGARAAYGENNVLCTPGNRIIASAVKQHGGKVYVLAEADKYENWPNDQVAIPLVDGSPAAEDPSKPEADWNKIERVPRIDILAEGPDFDLLIGRDLSRVETADPANQPSPERGSPQ